MCPTCVFESVSREQRAESREHRADSRQQTAEPGVRARQSSGSKAATHLRCDSSSRRVASRASWDKASLASSLSSSDAACKREDQTKRTRRLFLPPFSPSCRGPRGQPPALLKDLLAAAIGSSCTALRVSVKSGSFQGSRPRRQGAFGGLDRRAFSRPLAT